MALIASLLDWKDDPSHKMPEREEVEAPANLRCENKKCITRNEASPRRAYRSADGALRCCYCDHKFK